MRQRLAFRNERRLYRRQCDLSGKPVISVYRPGSDFVVYDQNVWWSDEYDPLEYGQEFDFSQPFFSQVDKLHRRVPKLSIHNAKSENCEFTNYSAENRNCYLAVGALGTEDCYYSYRIFYSKNIVDSFGLSRCELCYECSQGADLYGCAFATNCASSSNLFLCSDCVGCRDCFGCVNLRGRQYCIFNEQYTQEAYSELSAKLRLDPDAANRRYLTLLSSVPERSAYTINCESCSGDQLKNCRRCEDVYFLADSEDVIHAHNGDANRDCADLNFGDNCELQYQASNLEKNYRVAFAALAWYVSESFYVLSCFNSKRAFGCCGLKRQENCILNRQYSPAEYDAMLVKIAKHMIETREWGRFFPASLSPFLFEETIAAEQFPLSQEECAKRGYNVGLLPARSDAASNGDPSCSVCGRAFRIIPKERDFYRSLQLPEPSDCPDCRHSARLARRRPMRLRGATCNRCGKVVPSSANFDTVLCEACYVR
ncbi:MAG: hypothetical protein U0136_14415 [Bdellovibrionota bacterium]